MGVKIESSVLIARPVEEVFPFLLDLEKATKSDPSVESVVKTPEGPVGVGTRFRLRQRPPAMARFLGRRPESTMVYTRVEPNREFEFDAELGPLSPHMRVSFEPAEGEHGSPSGAEASQGDRSSCSRVPSSASDSASGTRGYRA
ncbi:MAG: SRPBCC family protein [Actinomycetota bacterium]